MALVTITAAIAISHSFGRTPKECIEIHSRGLTFPYTVRAPCGATTVFKSAAEIPTTDMHCACGKKNCYFVWWSK